MSEPVLYVFAGLPGSGKSTLAQGLCRSLGCVYLRIDVMEQSIRNAGGTVEADEGYRLGYSLAAANLKLGLSVVADSCNPITETRNAWLDVAAKANCSSINIEVVCSDQAEHRRRVEGRRSEVPGLILPTWKEVLEREYHPWAGMERLALDTSSADKEATLEKLLGLLKERGDGTGA